MESAKAHEVVAALKQLAVKLGRPPTRQEFRDNTNLERKMKDAFGGFSVALQAAGFGDASMGHRGKKSKKEKKFKYKPEKIQGFFRHEIDLKEFFAKAQNPQVLKIIVQPDTHVPYQDEQAVQALLDFSKDYRPHGWMILGDFADCEGISHWPASDEKPRRLVPEILEARKLLQRINAASPDCVGRWYLTGNHETWIEQALVAKIPELMDGLSELGIDLSLNAILGLDGLGWELYPFNHLVKLGKAHFTHGLYTGGSHAKKHLSTFKTNIFYGHLHDCQSHNETSMDGHMEAASLGCLARLDAKFLKGRPNNWVHSFATFEIRRDGRFSWNLHRIFEGRFSYSGILYPKKI